MIRRLTVSNFRSLGESVAIDLDPVTVLVGPNACGKSSVVDAVQFLSDAVATGLDAALAARHGLDTIGRSDRAKSGRPLDVEIRADLELEGGAAHYLVRLGVRKGPTVLREEASVTTDSHVRSFEFDDGIFRHLPDGLRPPRPSTQLVLAALGDDPGFTSLRDAIVGVRTCAPVPAVLAEVRRREHVTRMDAAGDRWAEALEDVISRGWKADLLAALRAVTGDVSDVRIRDAADHPVVLFRHDAAGDAPPLELYASQESGGTLRVAAILCALFQPASLLCVEEPEQTVHPGALGVVWDFIAECGACRNQVLVTTHSPELLDLVPPESVRIVSRNAGVSGVRRMSPNELGMVRDRLVSMGEFVRIGALSGDWADQVAESPVAAPPRTRRRRSK